MKAKRTVSGFKNTASFILLLVSVLFLALAVPSAILLALFSGGISIFPGVALMTICVAAWSSFSLFFITGITLLNLHQSDKPVSVDSTFSSTSNSPNSSAVYIESLGSASPFASNGSISSVICAESQHLPLNNFQSPAADIGERTLFMEDDSSSHSPNSDTDLPKLGQALYSSPFLVKPQASRAVAQQVLTGGIAAITAPITPHLGNGRKSSFWAIPQRRMTEASGESSEIRLTPSLDVFPRVCP